MRNAHRTRARAASIAGAVLILSVGMVPLGASAADHLDSPTISLAGKVDITDVYTFSTAGGQSTVFVVGVNPGAGVLPNSRTTFGTANRYLIKVDTDGDAKPDVVYKWRFAGADGMGRQPYWITRNGNPYGQGRTNQSTSLGNGARAAPGLYDDPFFFDLEAFKGQVLGSGNGRTFCDADTEDFFLGLNINALVLRVPNSTIGGNGRTIGVWATTTGRRGAERIQLDQMGRPAINTVFNSTKADKELFNRANPREQRRHGFDDNVKAVLMALGGYSDSDAQNIANLLIPDVMTFETGNTSGFLNGRRLADDVIDAELSLVTNGGITTDCVDNDSALLGQFPYLAPAN
jgi:hypothetical protein